MVVFQTTGNENKEQPQMNCAVIKTYLKLSERSEIVVKEICIYFCVSACAFIEIFLKEMTVNVLINSWL